MAAAGTAEAMMPRRAPRPRSSRGRDASYPYVVTIPAVASEPGSRLAEIDQAARSVSAGRCGRWTSGTPERLHVGFNEAAHRDAFVLWLTLSGIDFG
jgi:hypothetical protein